MYIIPFARDPDSSSAVEQTSEQMFTMVSTVIIHVKVKKVLLNEVNAARL